jgi:hypothetical protein
MFTPAFMVWRGGDQGERFDQREVCLRAQRIVLRATARERVEDDNARRAIEARARLAFHAREDLDLIQKTGREHGLVAEGRLVFSRVACDRNLP